MAEWGAEAGGITDARPERRAPPPSVRTDLRPALAVAAVTLVVHTALSGRYGFHRDELYQLVLGDHPAAGYPDRPPLVPVAARTVTALADDHLWPLRFLAGAAHTAVVVIAALVARELGGRRWATALAALTAATAPALAGAGSRFQAMAFAQLAAAVVVLLAVRLLSGADPRLWLGIGVALGLGLEASWVVVPVAAGLAAGLAAVPEGRRLLTTRWPVIAVAVVLALWLPHLAWEAANGWPAVEPAAAAAPAGAGDGTGGAGGGGVAGDGLLGAALVHIGLIGPVAVPVAGAGLVWLARRRPWRGLAVMATTVLALVLAFAGTGDGEDASTAYVVLLAAGAVATERWLSEPTAPPDRVSAATAGSRRRVVAALLVGAAVALPAVAPVVPQQIYADAFHDLSQDVAEEMGWPELVDQVAAVHEVLPARERVDISVITARPAEAAAVDRYGPARGLAPGAALSVAGGYGRWWPDDEPSGTVISVGYTRREMRAHFRFVVRPATVANRWGVPNDAAGAPILVCRGLLTSPDRLREALSRLQAQHPGSR